MVHDSTIKDDAEPEQGTETLDARIDALIRSGRNRYGTAEVSESGIDISMLRQNLRLTPTQRVRKMAAWVRYISKYRGTARPRV